MPVIDTAMVDPQARERIERLKRERDAVVLAHYYVPAEVQAVADYVGDSFYLAKLAVSLPSRSSSCAAWSSWARA